MALGVVSGLMVSRLLLPRGRGELAVLLYFPTLMGALFTLGTPQAVTALLSKGGEHTQEILTTGFRLAAAHALAAAPLFVLFAPLSLAGDNRHLASQVALCCAAGVFMVLVPYFNAMAYGLKRFHWVNGISLAGQGGYIVALIALWALGALTPLRAALAALAAQLIQCLLHLLHLRPRWLNQSVPPGSYRRCLALGLRFAAPSLAAVVLLNADRAILIRTTTLDQIGFYAIALAVAMPITIATEAFTQIGFVEVSSAESPELSVALMLRRFQMAQVVAAVGFLLVCAVIHPVIRWGFGAAYLGAIPAAYPLALAMSLRAMTRTLENNLRGLRFVLHRVQTAGPPLRALRRILRQRIPALHDPVLDHLVEDRAVVATGRGRLHEVRRRQRRGCRIEIDDERSRRRLHDGLLRSCGRRCGLKNREQPRKEKRHDAGSARIRAACQM